jgi:hypothetical protein
MQMGNDAENVFRTYTLIDTDICTTSFSNLNNVHSIHFVKALRSDTKSLNCPQKQTFTPKVKHSHFCLILAKWSQVEV